jgi:ankyrin repeat protein
VKRRPVALFGISFAAVATAMVTRTNVDARSEHMVFHHAGDLESTRRLIAYGDDVNRKEELDSTPLMQAARTGDVDAVKMLLDNHADIDASDNRGRTALSWCLFMYKLSRLPRYTSTIRLLVERGTNIDHRDKAGRTYLMSAIDYDNPEIASLLISRGADVNAADFNGHTALMFAVKGTLTASDTDQICAQLLSKRADRAAKNVDGKTALDIAHNQPDKGTRDIAVRALAAGLDHLPRDLDSHAK